MAVGRLRGKLLWFIGRVVKPLSLGVSGGRRGTRAGLEEVGRVGKEEARACSGESLKRTRWHEARSRIDADR
jgi:hypothetical protein